MCVMSPSSVHCRYFQIPKKLLEPVAEAPEEEEQPETSAEAEQEGAEDDTVELFNKLIDSWDVRCVWPGCAGRGRMSMGRAGQGCLRGARECLRQQGLSFLHLEIARPRLRRSLRSR